MTLKDPPYLVSEFCQFLGIIMVKLEFRLRVDQNPCVELATTKHDRGMHVRVLVQYALYHLLSAPWNVQLIYLDVPSGPGFVC